MREITKLMIYKWGMTDVDWMGYKLHKDESYNFHHLIVPRRNGGPYDEWNGAILGEKTSHPYLHVIEAVDYKYFAYITSELIDINLKGFLDPENLIEINNILCEFEQKYQNRYTKKGKLLIRHEYTNRVYNK